MYILPHYLACCMLQTHAQFSYRLLLRLPSMIVHTGK
jgi:hypothetical protein